MMHFSCDLCGKTIQPGDDLRYVVKIETCPAREPLQITAADLEEDHLEQVSQLLRDMEEDDETEQARKFHFDLCPACHKRFVHDPLAKEQAHKLFFSKN